MIFTEFAINETEQDALLAIKILFQPWRWQNGKDIKYLKRRLKSHFFSSDTNISLYLTGRAALFQYLNSLHLRSGDEVIVQAFTCEAVILPILELGLTPVYIDVNTSDFSMDINDLYKKYTSKAKAIIIQHTFGITPKNRNNLIAYAKKNKLQIIEDVAHGFDHNLFRSKRYSGAILLSFGRSKWLSSMFGGALAIRGIRIGKTMKIAEKNIPDPSLWILLQIIFYKINSVIIKKTYNIVIGKAIHFVFKQFNLIIPEVTKKEKRGNFDSIFLRTFPNIAAIFLLEQLNRFNDVWNKRKNVSSFFDSKLQSNTANGLGLLRYPFLCENPNQLQAKALQQNILLGRWYSQIVAPNELDLSSVGYSNGSCPNAEKLCKQVINLPTNISIHDAQRIVKILLKR